MRDLSKYWNSFRVLGALFFALLGGFVNAQTWTGNVDSDWTNASNWSGGTPSANSSVTIPGNRPNDPIITTSVTVKDLTIGDWNNLVTLTVDGGALTVSENVTLNDYGELKMQSGSILFDRTKNNASFTCGFNGTKLTLIAGTFTSDLAITINGEFHSGSANVVMNDNFTIASNKTGYSGSGGSWTINSTLNVNGTLDLDAANLDVYGTLTVASGGIVHAGSGIHNIYGVFDVGSNGTYNGENAYTTIYNSISAKNGAFITLNNGTIEFRGSVDLFQTASLTVLGSGEIIITGSGQFKQNGSLNVGDGTLTINGNVDFQQGGTLDVNSGNVTITGDATFSQSGTLNIESGSLNIDGDASFDQTGTVNATSADITISGDLTLGSTGSVFNTGSSTITLEGGTLTNNGTFNADSSTVVFSGDSTQTISGDITFYNVQIETTGTLQTTGDITVVNNATVDTSSTVSLSSTSTFEVQGELNDPNGGVSSPAPFVRSIKGISATVVEVEFSEAITAATASTLSNYAVNQGLTITSIAQQANGAFVRLTLSGSMTVSVEYTFVFNNLVGLVNGGTINANHTRRYTYVPLTNRPANGVSNFKLDAATPGSITVTWSNSNATSALIVIRKGNPTTFLPTNFTSYSISSTIGMGTDLGGGTYAVYAGSDSIITIEGLLPNENYFLSSYSFNGTYPSTAAYNITDVQSLSVTTPFTLDITAAFAGCYNPATSQMSSELVELGILPTSQPFNAAPWNYSGTESIASYPSNDIVDWVLVELRATDIASNAVDSTVKARQACFIMNDGSIVGLDGISNPEFQFQNGRPFIVIIYHRNHLPIMSSDTLTIDGSGVFAVNFANDAAAWYESNSATVSTDGTLMSSSGSSVSNGLYQVDSSSHQEAWLNRNSSGYSESDVNMDGAVNAADRADIFNSKSRSIQIPSGPSGG